jgi:hypothetical protein
MKRTFSVLSSVLTLSLIGGCVVAPPAPAPRVSYDPTQWHVVSVEPVQPGAPRQSGTTVTDVQGSQSGNSYAQQQAPVVVQQAPTYVVQPAYTPYYYYPYAAYPAYPLYPNFSLGLDFVIGGGHGWWGRGHYRGHGR